MVTDTGRLPLGLLEFQNIREKGKIYVDKTGLISKIAEQDTPIFFSRPRRFGKSLLISTLSCLFKNKLEFFHGLSIENTWNDKEYQVVHLDFYGLSEKNSHELNRDLGETIIKKFGMEGIVSQCNEMGIRSVDRIFDEICDKLKYNSTVLLIDEYDAPLTHNISNRIEADNIKKILNNFYSILKQYTDKFRLIFITGVTRVSHVSIFSSFNNLLDISLDEDFNSLLGFTKDDLEKYFDPYIENAAHNLKMHKNDVYKRMEQYYDGFQFALDAKETVYNPWSILSFLKLSHKGFKNYWFKSSGSSTLIMQYLKGDEGFMPLTLQDADLCISEDKLSDRYEITNIPKNILLFQTGYLTIRKKSDEIAQLVYPNTEVEDSIFKLFLMSNELKPDIKFSNEIQNLTDSIDNRNLKNIVDTFNAILNDCVSILSNIFNNERSVRDILYAALPQKINLQKIKERETAKGRSDLELLTQKTHMVIEFKRTRTNRDASLSLKEAVEQVKNKQYGVTYFQNYALYRVAMVISTDEKKILYDFCKEI